MESLRAARKLDVTSLGTGRAMVEREAKKDSCLEGTTKAQKALAFPLAHAAL